MYNERICAAWQCMFVTGHIILYHLFNFNQTPFLCLGSGCFYEEGFLYLVRCLIRDEKWSKYINVFFLCRKETLFCVFLFRYISSFYHEAVHIIFFFQVKFNKKLRLLASYWLLRYWTYKRICYISN